MHNAMPENYTRLSCVRGGGILGLEPNITLGAKRMSYFTETRFEFVRSPWKGNQAGCNFKVSQSQM